MKETVWDELIKKITVIESEVYDYKLLRDELVIKKSSIEEVCPDAFQCNVADRFQECSVGMEPLLIKKLVAGISGTIHTRRVEAFDCVFERNSIKKRVPGRGGPKESNTLEAEL